MSLTGLRTALSQEPTFANVLRQASVPAAQRSAETVIGAAEGLRAPLVAQISDGLAAADAASGRADGHAPVVLAVTATDREAEDLEAVLGSYLPEEAVTRFPAWETLPHERLSPRSDTVGQRLAVLRRLAEDIEAKGEAPAIPVVVVSAFSPAEGATAVDALTAGAFDLVAKPEAGGLPVALPHLPELAEAYLDQLDGLVVTGGAFDVDPALYGGGAKHETVVLKEGRTGPLCFVTVRHRVEAEGRTVLEERQDIVYRGDENAASAAKAPPQAEAGRFTKPMTADATLLFRYSALTFNGHRIHYDRRYVTEVEGYPGLIVHGPMQAAWLYYYASEIRGTPPTRFSFRGLSPLFDDDAFALHAKEDGAGLTLWTAKAGGTLCMSGEAQWD